MRIQVQLTDDDYIAYNIAYQFHSKEGKNVLLMGKLIPVVLSLVFVVVFILCRFSKITIISEAVILTGLCIWSVLTYDSRIKKQIRRRVMRLKEQGKLPYEQNATIDFSDEMIMYYSPNSTRKVEWSVVQNIWVDREYIFLVTGAVEAIIFPFRCLNGAQQQLIAYMSDRSRRVPELLK